MISISNLSVQFNEEYIFKDFSLDLPEQGSFCFLAPSGSGKTTLLRVLSGLQKAESGSLHGLENKRIAFLFQENRLLPHLSAVDNIKLVLPKERQEEAMLWLERLGLADSCHKTPLQLSGGMNRRLAIARTLAFGGDIYLLDEPFQGLDQATRDHCIDIVKKATAEKLLLLVSHHPEEAAALCERSIRLEGRPLQIMTIS